MSRVIGSIIGLILGVLALMLLNGCSTQAYQQYDRSHSRRIDLSYDADSQTMDLGYTITPMGPVAGYAK